MSSPRTIRLLFFTNRGRVYQLGCHEIPEAGRTARGTAVVNLLQLDGGEKVTVMLPMPRERVEGHYLVMATKTRPDQAHRALTSLPTCARAA